MKVVIDRNIAPAFEPKVYRTLELIPDSYLFHKQQGLRHPSALYHLSLSKIANAYIKAAELHKGHRISYEEKVKLSDEFSGRLPSKGLGVDIEDLLGAYESLLRACQEHIDTCFLILKTFVDPDKFICEQRFADQYVLKSKLAGCRQFVESIASIKRSFFIANKLKHQQGTLQGVLVVRHLQLGYYLEEPDAAGAMGPSRDIHPDGACSSFARELAMRLADIYRISERLHDAIERAIDRRLWLKAPMSRERAVSDWALAVEYARNLPPKVFPSEAKVGTPTFRMSADKRYLQIKFPDHSVEIFNDSSPIYLKLTRDGYSNSIKPPRL